jgi:2-iminobutanoate/2-iminopropanoate deaminase
MPKRAITSPKAKAIGPYSAAIESGDLVFVSGQIPLDPATGKLVDGDIAAQAKQSLENLKTILEAAGLSFRHVVKTTIFLTSMGDFAAVNEVYKGYLAEPYPARSTIAVAALPMGAKVEIEMVASR